MSNSYLKFALPHCLSIPNPYFNDKIVSIYILPRGVPHTTAVFTNSDPTYRHGECPSGGHQSGNEDDLVLHDHLLFDRGGADDCYVED